MFTRNNIMRHNMCGRAMRDWLCFTAEAANSTIRLDKVGSPDPVSLETSPDGKTWTTYTWSGNTGATITLPSIGSKVYWRASADNTKIADSTNFFKFRTSLNISVSGSLSSLMKKSGNVDFPNYNFAYLFSQSSITTAPDISGASAGTRTFMESFTSSSIEDFVIPDMPIIGDTSFIRVCKRCTSLRSVKIELKDVNRATFLYQAFQGCSSLNNVAVKFTSWPSASSAALGNWLDGVAATGTFYCPDELPDPDPSERGASSVPAGWTIKRPSDGYVQEGLVYQLDCKVGVTEETRGGLTRTMWAPKVGVGTLTYSGSTSADSKGGIINGNFVGSTDVQWSIEEGYSIEICGRTMEITEDGQTFLGQEVFFGLLDISQGQQNEDAPLALLANSLPLHGETEIIGHSVISGKYLSYNHCQNPPQPKKGVFTAYFHPFSETYTLNGVNSSGDYTIPIEPPTGPYREIILSGSEQIVYSIRVYNRALTADERVRNRQIDQERFG